MKDMKKKSLFSVIATSLLVVFVVLKLVGLIDWSWIWVLAPLWVDLILGLMIILVGRFILKLL